MKSLNDMDATVRESSAEALGTLMKVVGEKAITPFVQGVDEIKMKKVKECFDKAEVKYTAASAPPSAPAKPPAVRRPATSSSAPKPASAKKTASSSSIASSSKSGSSEELDIPKKVAPKKATGKVSSIAKPGESKPKTDAAESKPARTTKATTAKPGASRTLTRQPLSAGGARSKKEEETNAPLLPLNKMKDQRIADEKALRVLKWNFTAPREEFYTQLKEQMISAEWHVSLITSCFHSDFKYHIKAIDQMRDYLAKGQVDVIIANSDLILRWIAIRFFDTNPSVILKALELLTLMFDGYHQSNVSLSDLDANSFIPYLVIKSGDPKDAVRNKVHDIVAKIREIHPPAKLFTHLMTGLQSKNGRQRASCLDELANLIELCGMSVCQPSAAVVMKDIAKFIADRDNTVRNAALNCAVQVYFIEGEKVYKYVGNLSDKELGLLEERIKRASKSRASIVVPQAVVPPPTAVMSGRKITPEKNGGRHSPSPTSTPMQMEENLPKRITPAKANSVLQAKQGSIDRRPKSIGPLTLDMEEYEQSAAPVSSNSNMIRERSNFTPKTSRIHAMPHNSHRLDMRGEHDSVVDEILNLPDVNIKKSSVQPVTGSTMTKLINSSSKVDEATNFVMAQLSSQEINSALDSLSQLEMLLQNDEKTQVCLATKVDHLITLCYMHYRLIITKHLNDESLSKTEVVRLFRAITSVLSALFAKPFLAKEATRDILKELMSHIISLLVDMQLTSLADSSNIIKSLNNLATSVITSSDSTNILSALIKLLHDCMSGCINASNKFTEIVMKCLWKISRNIEAYFDSLDIDKILLDVHLFLKAFPSSWWKEGDRTDTPLRTIKTLTYLIVQHSGEAVFDHLTLITNTNESELYHYLNKALRQTGKLPANPKANQISSKEAQTQLAAIISKLGSEDDSKTLNELFEFTQSNPKVSVESCLENSSESLKNYVLNALRRMKERHSYQTRIPAANASSAGSRSNALKGAVLPQLQWSENLTPEDVIDWYKKVANVLGFDSSKYDDPAFISRLMNGNSAMSQGDTQLAVQRAQQTLENFKMICNSQKK